ncbi:aminoacyl-tRNA hydrolase [Halalkalibacterium halodurans]|jgi:PTH1 family peptidyl-tRNA hydrolase|uniref:Peptidyl-tRNA hydrolase n=2 Tax=Halalkalibacterium halodurans TaxID=86665 RepID=PTH_HALH5|nr:aminoacyl-tRNA hydrolase [Halalkalibacterium halodurans]Q9KGJ3.1 RecName: Full=Peptidyl-tRNA hydrolase; Short=PTH [Halalkalibacterium halodurans C-125]MED4080420.1 aminoacyl-tRNA hydrolase [Halalkalibacterium halodurans]MED4085603.1 aminoacyl-tRNA hydrolase [Halalkalibacterium halodurans]MED4104075.1 aminoacyl-tRNA hydrolase [Halalkalibacterium halodurans]MED4107679.1 aminoacyl-tRNA hydrolase [Halalkalibacterium halodurans]MED4125468.1 aminoacyl-tRNA hydrolase [Halalkalibacterium haloduran
MKLIVGLGNPGAKYDGTRHNVGFDVVDAVARRLNIEIKQSKANGLYGEGRIDGEKIFLLKPQTFMNRSGESVRPFLEYYNMEVEDLLVIYDDLDLPVGKIRLRQKGSAGGHNGMKSLIAHLGTSDFKRIRVGVDRPAPGETVVQHVLGRYRPEEKDAISEAIDLSAEAAEAFTKKPFLEVMNTFN